MIKKELEVQVNIEKTWFDMGARNIAYAEFPDIWRHLQEEEMI